MKKLPNPKSAIYDLLAFFVMLWIISCVGKREENKNEREENKNTIFKLEPTRAESTIDFNLLDCLNESNKKTISLANIAFKKTKDAKTLKSILEIKKDQQKISFELKELTEKNMIIIPKTAYKPNPNSDSLKGKNSSAYLLRALENEIKNEIVLFDKIVETSANTDFILFAEKYKRELLNNNNELKVITMN